MVEEAAEILEAHVLCSLSPRTKQLVMIGDHQQLRPKVESYELQVQSGKGHQLNVSLFERLVRAGFPHTTLAVQHRMHPDVSSLIRHTYPALEDHPSVAHRPPVLGLSAANRVVFIDHSEPEEGEMKRGWNQRFEHQSKVNMHEVRMAVSVVRFLLQQGYQASQLVLLTPYLGQLMELQRELSKGFVVSLNDLDLRDLRTAAAAAGKDINAMASASSPSGGSGKARGSSTGSSDSGGWASAAVRLATVDNYQGEEADVVVASLVRSNSSGKVGFLGEPERINVLLSRARHGMVIIGSAATLRHAASPSARKHWGKVLDKLEARGCIHHGLPAVCQQHDRPLLPPLDSPAAFLERAPDGGCSMPCAAVMPCGHTCPLACHAYDREHVRVGCKEMVYSICDSGHLVTRLCCQPEGACKTCVEIRRVQEAEKQKLHKLVSGFKAVHGCIAGYASTMLVYAAC